MFQCSEDQSAVQYSVVCDFRLHCPDSSDESFCEFPPCGGFQCSSSQCIPHSQRCNEHSDCLDDSDERDCPEDKYEPCEYCIEVEEADETRMLYKNLDGTGYFTQKFVAKEGPCGDTHYRCTSELFYCLPVYTRCNGFSDCVYGEDEQDCKTTTCPGLYRCRSSTVCVHGYHLCDGWGQCPQRDDELMCDMACPEECLCSGHSFLCAHSFPPQRFPDLRYVDATGSVNFMLCFMIVAGQAVIGTKIPKYRIELDPVKRPTYTSAQLVRKMAAADVLRWCLFGFVTVMLSHEVRSFVKINGIMAVFVLPLTCALNPLFYMWTIVTQRHVQAREEKLVEVLKSKHAFPAKGAIKP
ncbi:hypothetical protein ACOMHN_056404 [Nucella lapillus]